MLLALHIRNLAVIEAAELEFDGGLTVLTGETGAGKSILVDALALALGARADSRAVRAGADRLEVTASFDLAGAPAVRAWLETQELAAGEDCLLRRVVTAEGRSRGYLNGQPVTMQTLQELGEQLVDICGQQAHQSLRHAATQRLLLDQHGGHAADCAAVEAAFAAWREARDSVERLAAVDDQREARQELLRFQLGELRALALADGELAELEAAQGRLANSERLEQGLQAALDALYEAEDGAAQATVSAARRSLEQLIDADAGLEAAAAMLREAEILIGESADRVRQQLGQVTHDPARLADIDARLAQARALARKHRVDADALPALAERLAAELDELDHRDERLGAARDAAAARRAEFDTAAARLGAARRRAAGSLAALVTGHMQALGMPGGTFEVALQPLPPERAGAAGAERVEFRVTANPGQPPGPLAAVASGGELSRISLALQVAALGAAGAGTLIFDEVDAGVGGSVAEMVGARLRELGSGRQVLCVTHLPQVASQAEHHLRVSKRSDDRTTQTAVEALDARERIEEIARMLGGMKITARTRAHAREMLEAAVTRRAG